MINPISFLWKQLNGPQISAICNAIWQYFKDSYDNLLDYFYNLSIANANDSHLTFIGLLQGLARPLTDIPSVKYITMGEEYGYIDDPDSPGHKIPDSQYPTPYGFSELGDEQSEVARGGRFPAEDGITDGKRYISSYVFRALLAGNAASKGALGRYLESNVNTIGELVFANDNIVSINPLSFQLLKFESNIMFDDS